MGTTALDRHAAHGTTESVRRFLAKHGVAIYFALTIAISWTAGAIVVGPRGFPLSWERFERLGGALYAAFLAGPVVAGTAMMLVVHGRAGARDFFARLHKWRVGVRTYALALGPAIALAVASAMLSLFSPAFVPAIVTSDDRASMVLLAVAVSLLFGFFEEIGWTGFAIPELRRRHGAAATGAVVGLVWGAWHFPLFWAAGTFSAPLPLAILLARLFAWLPGFRVLMVRLYDRSGSLLPPMLMHAGLVATQLLVLPRAPLAGAHLVTSILVVSATIWLLTGASAIATSKGARDTVRPFSTSLAATLVFLAIVLVSAGRFAVWQAWVYAAISLALNFGQRWILLGNPELAKERTRARADAPSWDKALLGVGLLLTIAMLVTAGLQLRIAGGPSLSIAWFVAGVSLSIAGAFFFLWAMRENRFFSAVVRIQRERGHAVCTTGPYRIVRHPGNLGMIVGTLGFPLLFQSTWSIVPAALAVVALVVRTRLEDAMLTNELGGYREYRARTRFRLVPGVW